MTKPWNPRAHTGGRHDARGWTEQWSPLRQPVALRPRDIGLMALGGVFVGLVWAGWSGGGPAIDGAAPGTRGVPSAVRIVDGDTFWHAGEKIRIADIDTPEVKGRCAYEVRLAAQATARMDALLAAGPFELHPAPDGRDEDRYGRKLRIVTRDGRSLGDQLVSEGLARTWSGRREPWC